MIQKLAFFFLSIFGFLPLAAGQTNAACINPAFDKKIRQTIQLSVPTMDVDELQKNRDKYMILDIREPEEYAVSHIPTAKWAGYKSFDPTQLQKVNKNTPIVVYCSIGYRSEKVGERLQEMGFTQVYNLYGSIFEWVNRGYEVVDENNQPTEEIHTYNKRWSEWVFDKNAVKIW